MVKFAFIFATTLIVCTACNQGINDASKEEAVGNEAPGQPVETRPQDAGYKAAFEGQTRAPGVKTNTPYAGTVVTDRLNKPWGLVILPDGNFLVSEKEGTLRIVTKNGQVGEAIGGLPAVEANSQGGLLGLALDPSFASNRTIYWAFTEKRQGGNGTSVGRGVLATDNSRLEQATVIYRAQPTYEGDKHYGGRLAFDKTGNLFLTTGDRFEEERRPHAQDLTSGLGKIIRINRDGQPAGPSAFSGQANARPEIYSIGHRNPQGIAFHPQTGELWVSEMGPQGGDELNLIQPGKNYGWPVIGYGIEYNNDKVGEGITQRDGMEQPVYFWDPVLSPSGMAFYTGNAIPEWQNNLFIGGLNSYHIARLVLRDNRVVGEERLLADQQQRFRAVVDGNDGALYAITDEGRLYRIGAQQ